MSYTKIKIHYNSKCPHTKTLALSKKVQEYGDKHGYHMLDVEIKDWTHMAISYMGQVLQDTKVCTDWTWMDKLSYEWLQ